MSSISEVLAGLQATSAWQERVYKDIHAHPELSFQETKTAALAASKLKEVGYEVIERIGRTGVVGVLRNGEGQTVLARADMDALSVRENTGLPYASTLTAVDLARETVSVAHACGHDVHVTCLLGAAELLAKARRSWSGTFIALFQPAEEVAGGAKAMVEDGLLDRIPKPDVAFAQHVLAYPAGKIGTPYTYWGIGGTNPEQYERARKAGRVEQDIPVNHSEFYAPVIEPTLSAGTRALVVAALAYLSK